MAYIDYVDSAQIPLEHQVSDDDNIIRIHGVHSRTIPLHHDLYRELMYGPGPLSRIQREMIAVVVSAANACHYWVHHHGAGLRRLLTKKIKDEALLEGLLEKLSTDHTRADLTLADRAMLDYALKLTLTPGAMAAADVAALREVGFDDRGIHDVCAIVGYFAFVNRIADGLGVELE